MSELIDYLYIGTGPINIIDACQKADTGKKVVLVDSKEQIGGAWVAIEVGDYGRLEIGCHIWSYNKPSYAFLKNYLDLDLVKLRPQPYFLNKNTKLIYDHKNALLTTKAAGKFFITGKFKQLRHFLKTSPAARFPIVPKQYLYPKGGAREFQNKLVLKLESSHCETRLNTQVESLVKNSENWEAKLVNGECLEAKNIVLTATSSLKSIRLNNTEINPTYSNLNYSHFHLVLDRKPIKPLSYIRVMNHDFIHRISDVTSQLDKNDEAKTVLLIGVFDTEIAKHDSKKEMVDKTLDYLKEHKFVSTETQIEYSQLNKFETTYIDRKQRAEINALDNHLELIRSTDLIYGIHSKLKDWTID